MNICATFTVPQRLIKLEALYTSIKISRAYNRKVIIADAPMPAIIPLEMDLLAPTQEASPKPIC
jgi:hypothetical protein